MQTGCLFLLVPSSPKVIKAVPADHNSAIVSWSRPEYPRGRLTYYTVHWNSSHDPKTRTHTKKVDAAYTHLRIDGLPQNLITVIE